MSRFKVGDKVICLDPIANELTVGKIYVILDVIYQNDILFLKMLNDKGYHQFFTSGRFDLVEETEMNIDQEIAELEKTLQSLKDKKKEQDKRYTIGSVFLIGGSHYLLIACGNYEANLISSIGSRYKEESFKGRSFTWTLKELSDIVGTNVRYVGTCAGFNTIKG